MEATVCSRQRASAADFRHNMPRAHDVNSQIGGIDIQRAGMVVNTLCLIIVVALHRARLVLARDAQAKQALIIAQRLSVHLSFCPSFCVSATAFAAWRIWYPLIPSISY